MRADTHDGPEQDAPHQRPDTLMQLSRSSLLDLHLATRGRAIHIGASATSRGISVMSASRGIVLHQSGRRSRAAPAARRCRGAEETAHAQSHRYEPKSGSTLPVWRAKTHL